MLLLTARFVPNMASSYDLSDMSLRTTFLSLKDGRILLVEVREVAYAVEIEEPK